MTADSDQAGFKGLLIYADTSKRKISLTDTIQYQVHMSTRLMTDITVLRSLQQHILLQLHS